MAQTSPPDRGSGDGVLSVVMPAYNETETLEEIVRRVLAQGCVAELIIVDDGSTDGTRDLLPLLAESDPRVRFELSERNRGKGAAVRRGIQLATADYVVVQDADLEYDPADLPGVLGPLRLGLADVVYGSRFAPRDQRRVLHFHHELGNRFLTFLSNALTSLNLTDMETCYKAFRRPLIQNLELECDRFGFEPEVTAKLAKSPAIFYEVPINYHGRGYEEGKKITWRDGFAALWFILKFNLGPGARKRIKRPWSEIPLVRWERRKSS